MKVGPERVITDAGMMRGDRGTSVAWRRRDSMLGAATTRFIEVPVKLALLLLAMVAWPVLASGQATEAPARLEPIVVTPTRLEQQAGESPASVTVITADDIRSSPYVALDDVLRQVPSFSLFRRSSSVVGHPTTQGVSLRGVGPSGASRALVLVDGLPINDPFGGWVPWSRVPLLSIEQIEVVRGGGSALWGNGALGGVINVITRRPTETSAALEASFGNYDTRNFDVLGHGVLGPWRLSLEGNVFDTAGYRIVQPRQRGAIDTPASSEHAVFNGRLEFAPSRDLTLFLSGTFFDEDRQNGTRLQVNDTRSGTIAGGGTLRTSDGSEWKATAFAQMQRFHSTFSTQAPDRRSETLALDQQSPSTTAGGSLSWSRRLGDHYLLAGVDARWVGGETDERVFNNNVFLRTRVAGGDQLFAGAYVQDVWTLGRLVELVGSLRGDYWRSYDGFRRDTPPPAGVPARQTFEDVEHVIPSPRLAALLHATPTTDLEASVYQGFRVPTLNEQYRVFRVRNDVTVANAGLEPERMTGGELGVRQRWAPLDVRVTGFWNEVTDQIVNVTLARALPDCPVGTTCRQRQNVELTRIRGVETELEIRPLPRWRVLLSHIYTDARVVEARNQPALQGKRLAQVPDHVVTLGVRWDNPAWVNVAASVRYVGRQFEDDLNTLPLNPFTVVDLQLSRPLARWADVFLAFENLLGETYAVQRTSDGIVTTGAPRLVRGGFRLTY
jgi:iron complex outermembrane recepter protein